MAESGRFQEEKRSSARSGAVVTRAGTSETVARTAVCAAGVRMKKGTSRKKPCVGTTENPEGLWIRSPSLACASPWPLASGSPLALLVAVGKRWAPGCE
jgi:hypothetical protein